MIRCRSIFLVLLGFVGFGASSWRSSGSRLSDFECWWRFNGFDFWSCRFRFLWSFDAHAFFEVSDFRCWISFRFSSFEFKVFHDLESVIWNVGRVFLGFELLLLLFYGLPRLRSSWTGVYDLECWLLFTDFGSWSFRFRFLWSFEAHAFSEVRLSLFWDFFFVEVLL